MKLDELATKRNRYERLARRWSSARTAFVIVGIIAASAAASLSQISSISSIWATATALVAAITSALTATLRPEVEVTRYYAAKRLVEQELYREPYDPAKAQTAYLHAEDIWVNVPST